MMEATVGSFCQLLARSRLLTAEETRALHQRWRKEAKDGDTDVDRFTKWLVANQYVTEFQAGLLRSGHVDQIYFNEYKLLDRIGKGRMAGVYKAVHSLGQAVAIKVLPPSKAKLPQLLARFQREARLALRLKHPNVVRAVQTGEVNGLHYLVMEYLEGETVDDVLERRGKLPAAEAVRLIHQALLGLEHIHEQGLVHRDLKPGNLMLVRPANDCDTTLDGTVKILDIGLGKALYDEAAAGETDNFDLTSEGTLLGTSAYLAPEQARDARSADIRSDIYSLGCVLYHLLTGGPPFPDTSYVRQMMRHASEMARPLREIISNVPDGLQQIVSTMMAKDPAQRFPTPAQAAQALERIPDREQGSPRAPAAESRAPDYLREPQSLPVETTSTLKPPSASSSAPASIDVELLPVDLSKPAEPLRRMFELSRRDYVLLAVGAVGVFLAEGIGVLLARVLRRKPSNRESPSSQDKENPAEKDN